MAQVQWQGHPSHPAIGSSVDLTRRDATAGCQQVSLGLPTFLALPSLVVLFLRLRDG